MQDHINKDNLTQTGRPVILPATITGSPRYMHEKYQEVMAIYQKYVILHLFITITTNVNWEEIQTQLKPRQISQDCPDIVVRVFCQKVLQ